MAEDIFRSILQTTWQAAVLAVLILLAQWMLRERLSASWRYGLWMLLVVRLLMLATPQCAFSVFNLARTSLPVIDRNETKRDVSFPALQVTSANRIEEPFPQEDRFTPESHENPRLPERPAATNGFRKVDWFEVALYGWLAGVCFFGARLVWSNGRFCSRIARQQTVANEDVARLFDECRRALKVTQAVRLIESEEVESPAVYGFWRKRLLLPDGVFERFSAEELRCIFFHELAHIKRGDLGVNWLVSVLQVLHWMNPVLWLAFARVRADRELAADALALAQVGGANRVAYGETILKVVENLANFSTQAGLVGIAENKARLKERLRAIAQSGATRNWKWAAVGIAVAVAAVGLTDARQTVGPSAPVARVAATPVMEIFGKVVDPEGRLVGGVQVAGFWERSELYLSGKPRLYNPQYGHFMNEQRLENDRWNYCTTDAKGNFYLNDFSGAFFILAVHESGFARITNSEFSTNMTVKLQPWGRIEGTLWNYNKTVTNEMVDAHIFRDEGTAWTRSTKFETKTDEHGHFLFNFVPPGQFAVFGLGIREAVEVKPGETAVVKLGGASRAVVGKFKMKNPGMQVEWDKQLAYFTTTPRPSKPFKTKQDYDAWFLPQIHRGIDNLKYGYKVHCAKDGSFRVEQVEPGNYEMLVLLFDPKNPMGSSGAKPAEAYDGYDGTFEIPPAKANPHEAVDLGTIEVYLKQ
ncbi:MAG TPA: M56 family metallopeptidase [Verrucomicrobiae bacterium]|nr:M56 family metallopeptidase [Verrucomicrobiae bacterium]